ncbi:hypothetical protein L914_20092, partial [Phytophthora nicotianae]
MRKSPPPTTIRRATQSRIQQQLSLVADFLRSREVSARLATTLYMATTQGRLPSDAPLGVPTSSTFQQLQYVDEQQRIIDENASAAVEMQSEAYPIIRIMLHNVEVPVRVNIRDLRRVLGLPDWNLCPPFRQPNREPVRSPLSESADIEDEEHKNEENLLFE